MKKICGVLSKVKDVNYSIGQARGLIGINLKDVTVFVLGFIEKYSNTPLISDELKMEFEKDFERLQELLKERVDIEENSLFPLYTRLVANKE